MSAAETPAHDPTKKNVLILSICLGMAMTGTSIVLTISALVGVVLAPDPALATVPFGLQWIMTVSSTMPLSLLMRRFGRRPVFVAGQLVGCIGAGIATYAIFNQDFYLFALGSAVLGIHNACWQYYRFAAADTASEAFKSRAISYVLAGGVFAAVAGPELASRTHGLFEPVLFAGGYLAICCITIVAAILLLGIEIPKPVRRDGDSGRPLGEIVRQPVFIVAVIASMIGYGLMNLSMTATPLAMKVCGFVVHDTKWVIQAHILGMYVPSFFTGNLIKRFGIYNILSVGAVLMIVAAATAMSGITIGHFAVALAVLGIGWNFLFIGGTTLLTEAYRPEEKEKVQGCNDLIVFGTVALTAFFSGTMQHLIGWNAVSASLILPSLAVLGAVLWLRQKRAGEGAAA
ncbi:MAG TPA: MFS transporter [Rhodospirillaceae bacterium]|nr:MFS transporter [Rhodospirillaceae bacterium]HAA93925.1 MFS transporter [Rhodospirillaceae bacterium]HAT34280.1 MFS transporter [Rhodospirillaceae bacterium]